MKKLNLDEINHRHMMAVDKYYRMHGGLASYLRDFKEDTLHLEINCDRRWPKNPATTAFQIARDWIKGNPELASAKYFEAHITLPHLEEIFYHESEGLMRKVQDELGLRVEGDHLEDRDLNRFSGNYGRRPNDSSESKPKLPPRVKVIVRGSIGDQLPDYGWRKLGDRSDY